MKTIPRLLTPLLLLALGGCSTVSSMPRPDGSYGRYSPPQESLLPAEAGQMDDQAVARALNFRVTAPAKIRLALMQLPDKGNLWRRYDLGGGDSGQTDLYQGFVSSLRASPRLYDASYLPDLLLPEKRTLPALREAAARYQADMLLVFQPRCDLFTDLHLFKPDEVHAYCLVQAVLIDTRSGVVPFTSSATQEMVAIKQDADLDFDVTVRKARDAAVQKALLEIGHDSLAYIQALPQP